MGNHGFFGQIQDWVRIYNSGFDDIWSVRTKTRFECIVVLIVRTVASLLFLIPHNSWRQEPWCVGQLANFPSNPRFFRILDQKSGVRTHAGTENVTF